MIQYLMDTSAPIRSRNIQLFDSLKTYLKKKNKVICNHIRIHINLFVLELSRQYKRVKIEYLYDNKLILKTAILKHDYTLQS